VIERIENGTAGAASVSTGYLFARDAWGRGYATEALTAVLEWARRPGIPRIVAICHADHRASARVLEKCGFRPAAAEAAHTFPNLTRGVD
jgi:RimJ/RimL family protein N-acetyltransferase